MNNPDSHDALQQALQLIRANQLDAGKQALQVLANQNNAQAHYELGRILLIPSADTDTGAINQSIRIQANRQFYDNPDSVAVQAGISHLREAEKLGHVAATYRLAYTSLTETAEPLDWNQLAERLRYCCLQQHPGALCDAAVYFGRFGDTAQQQASTDLLEIAALKGSAVALALLGERLALGRFCKQDPWRANSIRALCAGLQMPTPATDSSLTNTQAEPAHTPQMPSDLDFSGLTRCQQLPDPVALSMLSGLVQYSQAFSKEECLYVQCLSEGNMDPSIVVDDFGNSQLSTERTSHDFYFLPEHEQVYLNLLQRRMAGAARLPLANSEQLTMLRYEPGQEFRLHRDNLPPNHFTAKAKGGSGQRQRTVIAYLERPERGGETEFPLLSLRVPAEQGQILCFDNLLSDGKLCRTSLHAGLPVIQGVKWICTLWMREHTHRVL